MSANDITAQIVDAAYRIHARVGTGLLESVCEVALAFEWQRRGLRVRRLVPVPVESEIQKDTRAEAQRAEESKPTPYPLKTSRNHASPKT